MFEVIGFIVVALIVWAVIKGIFKGTVKGTMLKACELAESLGVPHDYAIELSKHPELVTTARKELSKNNREFAMLDANEQYGHAIAALYEEECRSTGLNSEIMEKVKSFLQPQINQLKAEGTGLHINDITYVYLGALATNFSKMGINFQQIRDLVKYVFPEDEHDLLIDNGYQIVCGSSDFLDKMKDILPVVNQEMASGKGEFYLKYTRKAQKEIEKMFTEEFDPTKVSRTSFLDV
jgi:hypothetical protein